MSGHARRARAARRSSYAQHFLASATLARELVARAGVGGADCVVELGPGRGSLTEALAARAAHVLAIEIDPALVAQLAERFGKTPAVTIVHADALDVPMPATPFRVMANVPFNRTSAILRKLLDDPTTAMTRADLVDCLRRLRAATVSPVGPVAARADRLGASRRGRVADRRTRGDTHGQPSRCATHVGENVAGDRPGHGYNRVPVEHRPCRDHTRADRSNAE